MELSNLKPAVGSNKSKRRIGRGPGSGMGGTSTRGHKGAKSRSGYKNKVGFEGGQMPLQRRVPKFGFKIVTIDQLAANKNLDKVTIADLIQAGFVRKNQLVKILGVGTLSKKVDVEANAFSKKAEEIITAAGGTINKI